jgi:adenylate cyclase
MKLSMPSATALVQAALIVGVFVMFLLNVMGVLNFHVFFGSDVSFRANLLKNFLLNPSIPSQFLGFDFFAFLFAGIFLSATLPTATPIKASGFTLIASIPAVYVAYAYPVMKQIVPLEYTLLTILILFLVKVLTSYFVETNEKEKIISVFGRYVPAEVANAIGRHPEAFSLEGEARELTILFCDIKEFSTMSEHMEPRQLARMLNTYFTEMTRILHRHGATIDKYIGDAIMTFWNAPVRQENHPRRALRAALAMQAAMGPLRESFAASGWPEIEIGIGINTGITNVGNMGSQYRIAYTVVGDAVNLAARLEGLTRIYGTQIVVSESTMVANTDILFRELDHVRVRGKDASSRIFEPVCPRDKATDATLDSISKHAAALAAYYQGDWQNAQHLFDEIRANSDAPRYYELLSRRARNYAENAPVDWEGISNFSAEYTISTEAR